MTLLSQSPAMVDGPTAGRLPYFSFFRVNVLVNVNGHTVDLPIPVLATSNGSPFPAVASTRTTPASNRRRSGNRLEGLASRPPPSGSSGLSAWLFPHRPSDGARNQKRNRQTIFLRDPSSAVSAFRGFVAAYNFARRSLV